MMKTAHDVKLLNGSKQEVTYPGVETVTMPGTDGTDKVFTAGVPIDALEISPDFSAGDMPLEAPEGYVVRGATIKKPEGAEQLIAKGQTLAGISGAYVTPGTVKEIEPDFSGGDQTVTAEGDERWNVVTVKKPEGLVPENVVKDVEIAGVVGAFETPEMCLFMRCANNYVGRTQYFGSTGTNTAKVSVEIPLTAKIKSVCANGNGFNQASYSNLQYPIMYALNPQKFYTDTIGESSRTISWSYDYYITNYGRVGAIMMVIYTVSGITLRNNNTILYCDSTVTEFPKSYGQVQNVNKITKADLHESTITTIDYAFYGFKSLIEVILPDSLTSIGSFAFYTCSALTEISIPSSVKSVGTYAFGFCIDLKTVDFSTCTSVPTLVNTNAFSGTSKLTQIKVPVSLYEEWIAATNWSTYADKIVAV